MPTSDSQEQPWQQAHLQPLQASGHSNCQWNEAEELHNSRQENLNIKHNPKHLLHFAYQYPTILEHIHRPGLTMEYHNHNDPVVWLIPLW